MTTNYSNITNTFNSRIQMANSKKIVIIHDNYKILLLLIFDRGAYLVVFQKWKTSSKITDQI